MPKLQKELFVTILWKNIRWAPIFFQVLFPRLKDAHREFSLTFKVPIQRKCEKTLCRKLQTEPSDAGRINQSAQE